MSTAQPNISNSSLRSYQIHPPSSCDLYDLFSQISLVCFIILMNLIILTCVPWKTRSNADLQRFARRLQYRYVSLTLDKHNLPGAAATQEAPVLFLQLHLQSAGRKRKFGEKGSTQIQQNNLLLFSSLLNIQSVENTQGYLRCIILGVFLFVCLRVVKLEW